MKRRLTKGSLRFHIYGGIIRDYEPSCGHSFQAVGREGAPDLTFTPYEVQVQVNTQEQCSAKVGGRAMLMHNRENHNNNMMCAGVNENGGRNLPASCRVNFSQYYTIQNKHFYCHFSNDEM